MLREGLDLLTNPLVLILLAASVISGLLGEALEATIIVVVLLSVGLDFFQVFRSHQATSRLRSMIGRSADPADPSSRWDVLRQRRRAAPELVAAGLAIGYAQGIAEDLLRQAGVASVLFDPAAPWRARPATDKQRAVLERLRVEIPDGLTAGEASDLISATFARRRRTSGP